MPPPLPRALRMLLRLVVPRNRQDDVLGDLEDDYHRRRAATRRRHDLRWLLTEAASLLIAFAKRGLLRTLRWPGPARRNLRLAARGLMRQPLATTAAAGMLGCGVLAALTAVSLSSALLLKPLSARHGDRVQRMAALEENGRTATRFAFAEADRISRHLSGAVAIAAVSLQPVAISRGRDRLQTLAEIVNGEYFAVIPPPMILGRALMSADDRSGAAPAAVISDVLWRDLFNRAPDALGAKLNLNGTAFTIVGIAPPAGSTSFFGGAVDIWVTTASGNVMLNRGWREDVRQRHFTLAVFASPGVTAAEIDARLARAAADLRREFPVEWRTRHIVLEPGLALTGTQRRVAFVVAGILGGLALLILLAAAANTGGVLLARAAVERRASAIHMAIGASRGTVVARLLTEGTLLGAAGGALAVAAYAYARVALSEVALLPTLSLRLDLPFGVDVMGATLCLSAAMGLLIATGPALWSGRVDLARAMSDGSGRATTDGARAGRVRRALVGAQVACATVLLVGAVHLERALVQLAGLDLGFESRGLIAMDFDVEPSELPPGGLDALGRMALDRARTVPGVTGAALASRVPVDMSTPTMDVWLPGTDAPALGDVTFLTTTAGYFETVGIPIAAGRAYSASEADRSAPVVVVNQVLAERLWNGDAVDRALELGPDRRQIRVVGIARNARYRTIDEPPQPHVYVPHPPAFGHALVLRTSDDPRRTLAAVQDALDAIGPGIVGFFPRTHTDHLAIQLLPTRVAARAATWLAVLAAGLCAIGLYALVSWLVETRRREIGVRMALGATGAQVRRLVVGHAVWTAAPGAALGCGLAVAAVLAVRGALMGVGPFEVLPLASALLVIATIVVAATWIPARRASRTDPIDTLRNV